MSLIKDDFNITDTQLICNEFNNFFVNIGPDLANNIKQDNLPSVSSFLHNRNTKTMFLKPVDELEIKSVVLSYKCKLSQDADDQCMLIMQQTISFILEPLMHIFKLSFKNGVFPNSIKPAKIIPIVKKGKKDDVSNYIPISNV